MKFDLSFVIKATNGKITSQAVDRFSDYSIDNRDPHIKDTLFIPLVGESHDAHKFVKMAIETGASGVLYHQWNSEWETFTDKVTFIEVEDTLKALQHLANH
ncbi:MAG: UDP-N-acetylmuramoylalanyl-D-glutamyl-2, 6-diaminopimelate--D-alanyl-D-alanine ligase, partial [Pseudomonadota bacterium]